MSEQAKNETVRTPRPETFDVCASVEAIRKLDRQLAARKRTVARKQRASQSGKI